MKSLVGETAKKYWIQKGGGVSGTDVPSAPCKRKQRARGGRVLGNQHCGSNRQGQQ